MSNILDSIIQLIYGGLGNLAAYLAAHVLLCLLPAFFIAGAMTALIPKEMITRYLGRNTPMFISYPMAAAAGFLLAVCSCTIVPLFAGIYKKGAGLGPAITFLFVAPAGNILAISYTGAVIGMDLAIARMTLSTVFGIGIGILMSIIFRREDLAHDQATDKMFAAQKTMRRSALIFLVILVALLLIGTLQINLLKSTYFQFNLPIAGVDNFQAFLHALIPFDPSRGEEGVSVQGALLIGLLMVLGFTYWKGFERIQDGFNSWTWNALGLSGFTLFFAALGLNPQIGSLQVLITGKTMGVFLAILSLGWMLKKKLSVDEIREFLWETWKFIKQIFPLLIVGVFTVGIIRGLIRPEWIEALAGQNSLLGNFVGVVFGVFMYFPTLVEVPIAQMFLSLGMHRGPLLAYLMSDPELSLQSILITATIIGKLKAWVYVGWVALFSTLAGLLYGAWVDGSPVWLLTIYIFGFLGALTAIFWMVRRGSGRNATPVITK
jgi:hypothetical protein